MNHSSPSQPPPPAQAPADDPSASSLYNWYDLLDFNIEDSSSVPIPHPHQDATQLGEKDPQEESPGRIRKRNPRLACSNFLAGRIPCACPEFDAKFEEEGEEEPSKKRTRTARVTDGAPIRCQVPGCEADISELKGYHRRHRVCLRCTSAASVVLDGESKRYCQQCGRFHVLLDFDEGRRSCRRKLEKHNRRRRRKQNESKESAGNETKQIVAAGDASDDEDNGKDGLSASAISQTEERGASLDSDVHFSTLGSALGSHSIQTNSIVSNAMTAVTRVNEDVQNPESKYTPSYLDNKSYFSSVCPTGRISFKLYDWNPAEFPRSLRLQIFQWLASMPVELESYIRPGCTILTAFIAMPGVMWQKLLEEPKLHINDLLSKPQSMLFGRGTMFVYLNDMTFHVTKDATSVKKMKVGDQAPNLHYIYPNCFESGKPMEFVACGSHLLQPDFRFLISFAGQYLVYNICVLPMCYENGDANRTDHQLLKIFVPEINRNIMGPAFIEVENESGLSNFIPILVGDMETCSEMNILQQRFNKYTSSQEQMSSPHTKCEEFAFKQAQMSEFILDTAWLLKKPRSELQMTSIHIQRFNHFLNFLIENKSCVILKNVLCCLNDYMDKDLVAGNSDSETRLLRMSVEVAQSRLAQNLLDEDTSMMPVGDGALKRESCQGNILSVVPATSQKVAKNIPTINMASTSPDEKAIDHFLKGDFIMMVNPRGSPGKIRSTPLTRPFFNSRPLFMSIVAIGVCLGICAIALQPQRVY